MLLQALRVVWLQVGLTVLLSLGLWGVMGQDSALSSFWGGASAFIPALAYQARAQLGGSTSARDALRAQYAGESFKFVVSIVMFYLVFTRLQPLDAPIFFATYVAALMCYFGALLTDKANSKDRKDS
jgi:ATP synthase protein I